MPGHLLRAGSVGSYRDEDAMHEVYAYGVIAPSTLIEVRGDFPSPGGYAEITSVRRSIGGEAAAGAYVLARLGVATRLAGNRIGSDAASADAVRLLEEAGVDCSRVSTESGTGPVTEVVVSSGTSRTIFGTYTQLLSDQAWEQADVDDVRASRIVCLDPFFGEASEQASRWCREAGVPYVTVDVSPDSEIAHYAEVVIVSEEFAVRELEPVDWSTVIEAYGEQCRGLVIVTRGGEPFLYQRPGHPMRTRPPFAVEVLDTTGAGDSFRAGIIYGMLQGYDDERLVEAAAAVAALVCGSVPGVLLSPTAAELEAFLEDRA